MKKIYELECVCDFCKKQFKEYVDKQTYNKYRMEQPIKSVCDNCFDKLK